MTYTYSSNSNLIWNYPNTGTLTLSNILYEFVDRITMSRVSRQEMGSSALCQELCMALDKCPTMSSVVGSDR